MKAELITVSCVYGTAIQFTYLLSHTNSATETKNSVDTIRQLKNEEKNREM
jgi:hypothetical protein